MFVIKSTRQFSLVIIKAIPVRPFYTVLYIVYYLDESRCEENQDDETGIVTTDLRLILNPGW